MGSVIGGESWGGGFWGWSRFWVPCHGAELAPQRVASGCAVRCETGGCNFPVKKNQIPPGLAEPGSPEGPPPPPFPTMRDEAAVGMERPEPGEGRNEGELRCDVRNAVLDFNPTIPKNKSIRFVILHPPRGPCTSRTAPPASSPTQRPRHQQQLLGKMPKKMKIYAIFSSRLL